jgi:putative transposase
MLKTSKYKIEANQKQRVLLKRHLDICRELHNMSLEQTTYRRTSPFEQMRELTELRATFPEYKEVHVHVLQNVIKKLHRSFECMWELGAGFPRFKSKQRYHSFSFNNTGFSLDGNQLSLSKIGNVNVRLSRPIPEGSVIKSLTVKETVSGWSACFAVEVPTALLPASDQTIGIDLGIENYAALSNGEMIQNPRFYENGQAELKRAQGRVARRKPGSHGRAKAVVLLRKVHERIANHRSDFLHKQTSARVRRFGTIVIENLNIKGLAQGILNKQVHDAGWSQFMQQLKLKAASAGRRVVEVDCRYSSQECPACKKRKKKSLAERSHECECGFSTHRDTAAAQVLLARAEPVGATLAEVIA